MLDGFFKKVEVLRVGTFRDGSGAEHTFSEQDLAAIAASYDPSKHEAPVVVGHPADNAPAFGWVKRAFAEGKSLFLELKDMVPEFVEACRQGIYKKRSIALYPDRTLRHIGFLGGMPPVVKGLRDIQFADKNPVCIEFTETSKGEEDMDLAQALARIGVLEGENTDLKKKVTEFSEKASAALSRITTLTTDLENKTKEVVGLNSKIQAQETATRKAGHLAFCEKLIGEGRLLPKLKDETVDTLELKYQASQGTFAEGEVKPIDRYKKVLSESPKIIEFGEVARGGQPQIQGTAGEKLNQLIRSKMADDKTLTFSEASKVVQIENIELANEYAEELRGDK